MNPGQFTTTRRGVDSVAATLRRRHRVNSVARRPGENSARDRPCRRPEAMFAAARVPPLVMASRGD